MDGGSPLRAAESGQATAGRPQIIYALVMRDQKVVLVDYTGLAGNFQQATVQILSKLEPVASGKSYTYGDYAFHYIIHEPTGSWFVCMAEKVMGRRMPFTFLDALRDVFLQRYTEDQVKSAIAYAMQGDFKPELQALMERYNSLDADRIAALSAKVQHINDNLTESIDKILRRQEQIELLVNRSADLSDASTSFQRVAHTYADQQVWYKNRRTVGILIGASLFGVLFIVMTNCGIFLNQC